MLRRIDSQVGDIDGRPNLCGIAVGEQPCVAKGPAIQIVNHDDAYIRVGTSNIACLAVHLNLLALRLAVPLKALQTAFAHGDGWERIFAR